MNVNVRLRVCSGAVVLAMLFTATATAGICVIGPAGDLPPDCTEGYVSPTEAHMIIDGLPPDSEIIIDASHNRFFGVNTAPGGNLGGEIETFGSGLTLQMTGTGVLDGFSRLINIPDAEVETHIGPRNPSDPVQDFDTEMVSLQGQLFGDPDFQQFQITAGSAHGLPSPGHTTLTRLPSGDFSVDSFFDIEYRIDFQGAPGGPLDGFGGSTTATIRMQAGQPFIPEPASIVLLGLGLVGGIALVRKSTHRCA